MIHLVLLMASIAVPPRQPIAERPALVEAPPAPDSLTLYNQKGEQVAKCQIVDAGERITGCKIIDSYTLDDLMTAWADAYKKKPND